MSTSSTNITIQVETTMPLLEIVKWSTPIINHYRTSNPSALRSKRFSRVSRLVQVGWISGFKLRRGSEPFTDLKYNLDRLISCLRSWDTSSLEYGVFEKTPYTKERELIGHCKLIIGSQWPELSYMFKKESWGKGFATEAVKAFMQFWWS